MTFIVHFDLGRRVRYGTVAEDTLHVTYQPKLRTKRISQHGIREMERVGHDKSRVWLRFSSDAIVNEHGTKGLYPGNTQFKLLERHKHIRRLTPGDEDLITASDRGIAGVLEELRALREARAELVAAAWRRSEKLAIDELEGRADARV